MLISLIELFTPLVLVINWNPGKTEVMDEHEKLRSENGFGVPIQGTDLRATSTWAVFCRVTFPT